MNQDEALSVSERINTRFHDARRGAATMPFINARCNDGTDGIAGQASSGRVQSVDLLGRTWDLLTGACAATDAWPNDLQMVPGDARTIVFGPVLPKRAQASCGLRCG